MAGKRFLYGGGGGGGGGGGRGGSNMNTVLIQNKRVPCSSSSPIDSLFLSGSSPSFLGSGSRSMVSFEDANGANRSFFRSFDEEDNGDDDLDDFFHQPEKKRRLKSDQVQFLEKSFEAENKLEPDRKVQLAKDLGLQPRQVAIWFQNRRARWKTKQLEKDYDVLQASYNSLKADYGNLLKEKEKLKAEVLHLTDKLLLKENEKGNSELSDAKTLSESPRQEHTADVVSEDEVSQETIAAQQEDLNSAKSDVFDTESPRYVDGVHSSFLDRGDSSYVFEPDQSDVSQDEEDNLSKSLLPPLASVFTKIEDADFPDPPANSCYFGFPVDDHAFGFWSY